MVAPSNPAKIDPLRKDGEASGEGALDETNGEDTGDGYTLVENSSSSQQSAVRVKLNIQPTIFRLEIIFN